MVSLPYIKSAKRLVHRGSRFTTAVVESKGDASDVSHHQQTQETSDYGQVGRSRHGVRWPLPMFRVKTCLTCGCKSRTETSQFGSESRGRCFWCRRTCQEHMPHAQTRLDESQSSFCSHCRASLPSEQRQWPWNAMS